MNVQRQESFPPPPGILGSLKAGFDIVSNRLILILLPLGLDLLLWLGPRLSVSELLSPYFTYVFEQVVKSAKAGPQLEQFVQGRSLFIERLHDFNLLSLLAKWWMFPIGIMGLSPQTMPVANPLGAQTVVQVTSAWVLVGLAVVLAPLSWIGGGVYFRQVAGSALSEKEAKVGFLHAIVQTVLLTIVWTIGLMIIFIPVSLFLGILAEINMAIANVVVFIGMIFSFWLIVPLFFTPHGIFIRKQNAFYSIYSSLRMTRFSLSTSGLFVLSVFILSRGFDILWSAPAADSWLALVGFAGHAFITTTLLAGSFVYYRDMTNWLQNMYEKFQQTVNRPPFTT